MEYCNNDLSFNLGTLVMDKNNNNQDMDTDTTVEENCQFQCKICGEDFVSAFDLETHVKLHGEEKPFQCEHCHKSFSNKRNLKRHLTTQTGEKFDCAECGKIFTLKGNLKHHVKNVHTKPLKHDCSICCKTVRKTPQDM